MPHPQTPQTRAPRDTPARFRERLPADEQPLFHERRGVPWWWWLVGSGIAMPTTEAVVVLGPDMTHHATTLFAVTALTATFVAVAIVLLLLGSKSDIDVDRTGLHAGAALLSPHHIGRARTLDATQARRLLGPGLRADALLSLRPWVKTAIQVEVDDDPTTPYWVVATRRPTQLLAALAEVRLANSNADPKAQL